MEMIKIVEANLENPLHQQAVLNLVDAYASDAMGDGKPLSEEARSRLIPALRIHPTTVILLAYKAEHPVGIAVCFRGFSTFAAAPLLNIHDFAVLPGHRGEGIARQLMSGVERKAGELGCCKLTLEVQQKNRRARKIYQAAGFTPAVPQAADGDCLFLSKNLAK
jgi:GNAT superfamily N-acetyltransferase